MRGSAVVGPVTRLLVVSVLLTTVVACSAADPATSPGSTATVDVTIMAASGETTAFEPAETVLAASGPISITFLNASSLPHNLTFLRMTAATRTIVEPGTSDEFVLSPLAEGSYPFVCTIHEGMAGLLIIQTPQAD